MSCFAPFYVDNPAYPHISGERQVPVPCGKCPPCLQRRASQWGFRLQQHEKISKTSCFVTLTYDNESINITPKGYMTLVKKDWQLFMKRFRKLHPNGTKIKYYAVGEYGSKNYRPHFHAIIFNADVSLQNQYLLEQAWSTDGTLIGDVHVGLVSGASIAYTTKYIHKGKLIPVHCNDDRLPEFSLMSKRLGANYITPRTIKYHTANGETFRPFLTLPGGVKLAMPRYYKDKIFNDLQKQIINTSFVHRDADNRSLTAYVKRTGSPEGFDRSIHEAKKAAIENFNAKALLNRNL